MLRSLLIYLSKANWARRIITRWKVAWRVASRFVAGETLADGIRAARKLNNKSMNATLDHLGEHTHKPEDARRARDDIIKIVDAIENAGVRSNISVKLTQIGLALSEDLCAENLACILKSANEHGIFVRLDMEDSPWVDATLRLYRKMRFEQGLDNIGLVIQSYLYRSEEDVRQLSSPPARIRLCKGAYKEPEEIAFPKKKDVDENYDRLTELLMDISLASGSPAASPDGKFPPIPAIATHDDRRVGHAKAYAAKIGLSKDAFEFQFLHGIRRDLQEQLVREGYPVRIYIPYGTEWYPYFVRRLAERPANVWFFISNLFRR
jgi:proline dehydrogenase